MIRVQGNREYLPVAARLIWFRQECPDWGIVTEAVEINLEKQYSIFRASIFNEAGKVMATATKFENKQGFGDFIEKSETGSVGRALAMCGFGTQFEPEFDEESRYADAPQPAGESRPYQQGDLVRKRDEATRHPESEASTAQSVPKPNALAGKHCSVQDCPNVLTAGQMTMTMNKFGRPLCLLHQKDARPVAKPAPETAAPSTARKLSPEEQTERDMMTVFCDETDRLGIGHMTRLEQGRSIKKATELLSRVMRVPNPENLPIADRTTLWAQGTKRLAEYVASLDPDDVDPFESAPPTSPIPSESHTPSGQPVRRAAAA